MINARLLMATLCIVSRGDVVPKGTDLPPRRFPHPFKVAHSILVKAMARQVATYPTKTRA